MARLLLVLLEIVIGLALVGTVATSTTSGSTALASFTNAQALVIIIPLIFVALILFGAYQHFEHKRTRGGILIYERIFRVGYHSIMVLVHFGSRTITILWRKK
jgi:hypothetical protein